MGLTIGVDIGGTKIAAGVVDEEGSILETCQVPTPHATDALTEAIAEAVRTVGAGHHVEAVGIGAAGYVDEKRATVLFAPNIDWRHEPLKDKVEQRVGLPVVVENDANAAAWGEYKFGAGQGHSDVICITLGTDLGGGIIIGNKLRRGRFGVAAEFGHIRVVPDGLLCGCGNQGCWEQYASGRALLRYARQRAFATPENAQILLSLGDGTSEGIQGRHVSEAARQGDPVAIDSFRELARWAAPGSPTSPRSSTRPRSSSAAASRTRANWSWSRSASPSAAGWSATSGGRTPRCSPPSSAARPVWSARPTWRARADPPRARGARSSVRHRPSRPVGERRAVLYLGPRDPPGERTCRRDLAPRLRHRTRPRRRGIRTRRCGRDPGAQLQHPFAARRPGGTGPGDPGLRARSRADPGGTAVLPLAQGRREAGPCGRSGVRQRRRDDRGPDDPVHPARPCGAYGGGAAAPHARAAPAWFRARRGPDRRGPARRAELPPQPRRPGALRAGRAAAGAAGRPGRAVRRRRG